MVVRFAHNNAKMETTVFSLDATLSGGDSTDIDKFMIAFDFKQKNLSSVHKPFWIFKPSLFDLVPFAERHESPEFHKSYAWMAEATKREKPFGESKPLLHSNKNMEWRHFMLVTWIEMDKNKTIEEQVNLFIADFQKMCMTHECQHRFHMASQMKYASTLSDLMKPLKEFDHSTINRSLWASLYAGLKDPNITFSHKLKEKFLDDDVKILGSLFFKECTLPEDEANWSESLISFLGDENE